MADKVIKKTAKTAILLEEPPVTKCVICASEVAPNSTEGLCWVCRRLKISAWADSDNQAPVQD
ncbi:hypothetical protein [Bryobacter aggregatus]|uniref:hypothetical protein n=1 Tax=Bryobacter aggregatus TaxID=360054 RepID=UPI0004E2091C|nr:hypothetical protein [Bryobacter aggregatus]